MQQVNDNSDYELVIDGEGAAEPLRYSSDSPGGLLCWAERQHITGSFEIFERGRRMARVKYLPSQVWFIGP